MAAKVGFGSENVASAIAAARIWAKDDHDFSACWLQVNGVHLIHHPRLAELADNVSHDKLRELKSLRGEDAARIPPRLQKTAQLLKEYFPELDVSNVEAVAVCALKLIDTFIWTDLDLPKPESMRTGRSLRSRG